MLLTSRSIIIHNYFTFSFRIVSKYTNEEALAEMKRLCNRDQITSVYKFGKKLGSGSGGVVYEVNIFCLDILRKTC